MIIAEQKPLTEIQEMIAPYSKILVAGCGTCSALCPNIFVIGDDGKAFIKVQDGKDGAEIAQAIEACPVDAIYWE